MITNRLQYDPFYGPYRGTSRTQQLIKESEQIMQDPEAKNLQRLIFGVIIEYRKLQMSNHLIDVLQTLN